MSDAEVTQLVEDSSYRSLETPYNYPCKPSLHTRRTHACMYTVHAYRRTAQRSATRRGWCGMARHGAVRNSTHTYTTAHTPTARALASSLDHTQACTNARSFAHEGYALVDTHTSMLDMYTHGTHGTHGTHDTASRVEASQVEAGRGKARRDEARRGEVRQAEARQGEARPTKKTHSAARCGPAPIGTRCNAA